MPSRRHLAASIPVSDPADAPPMASIRTAGSSPWHSPRIAHSNAASAPPSYAPSATAPEIVSAMRSLTSGELSARGALRPDLELAEGHRLDAVGVRLLGQPEDALADDVLLHLVAAPVDRHRRREQRELLRHSPARSLGAHEHPVRPEDLETEIARQTRDAAHEQLRRVAFGTRPAPRRLCRLDPQTGEPADLVEDVQLRQPLADVRVLVATDVLGQLLEQVRLTSGHGALGAVPSPAGGEITDAPLELLRLLPGHRATDGSAAAAAEPGALVRQRRVGDSPAAVQVTDHRRLTHTRVREEHLAEEGPPRHLAQRPHLDARLVHLDGEVRDALVLRRIGIGARDEHAEVGGLTSRCPDLLPVDDPFVAVALGAALEAGEVGAGAGLTEQLTPRLLPVQDRPQIALPLRVVTVRQDRRAGEQHAETGRRPDRSRRPQLLVHDPGELARQTLPEPLLGPGGYGPARLAQPVPPLRQRDVRVPLVGEPAAHFVPHQLVGDDRHD